jgi:hypothetical protein
MISEEKNVNIFNALIKLSFLDGEVANEKLKSGTRNMELCRKFRSNEVTVNIQ